MKTRTNYVVARVILASLATLSAIVLPVSSASQRHQQNAVPICNDCGLLRWFCYMLSDVIASLRRLFSVRSLIRCLLALIFATFAVLCVVQCKINYRYLSDNLNRIYLNNSSENSQMKNYI